MQNAQLFHKTCNLSRICLEGAFGNVTTTAPDSTISNDGTITNNGIIKQSVAISTTLANETTSFMSTYYNQHQSQTVTIDEHDWLEIGNYYGTTPTEIIIAGTTYSNTERNTSIGGCTYQVTAYAAQSTGTLAIAVATKPAGATDARCIIGKRSATT